MMRPDSSPSSSLDGGGAQVRHIGIALTSLSPLRKLQQLERALDEAQRLGFQLVELDIAPFGLIMNGALHDRRLSDLVGVLRNFDLRYTVHGLMRLNLAYDSRHELCRRVMARQIEICGAIGASVLVHHSGLQALDEVRYGVRRSLPTDEELAAGARREVDAFRELAPMAADRGLTIAIENGDPHQWEYNVLARFSVSRSELIRYHPRLHVDPIIRQLEAIDQPNVGMTLDVGHLYIAANDLRFDFLAAVRRAAPWVRHIHAHDNFGLLDRGFDAERDRWPFGEADVHLPPGWGNIPHRQVLDRLSEYKGDIVLEIKPDFLDEFEEALLNMETILDDVRVKAR